MRAEARGEAEGGNRGSSFQVFKRRSGLVEVASEAGVA